MFGLQIRGSVSRSNSVIRTASGCSAISNNQIFHIKNHPNEHRISRSQNRYSSGIRSISHPTDLSTLFVLKKATATTDHTRYSSRSAIDKKDEDYEEHEEVQKETGSRFEEEEEQEVEETQPKYAVSFLPYFQKQRSNQFRENDYDTEDLNQEAQSKYSRAVRERDITEAIRYRPEIPEDDDMCTDAACKVRDIYKEQEMKEEEKSYPHLQPCNIRPFGTNDSLFFPQRNSKAKYPIYRKFGESDPPGSSGSAGGASQQRDFSTTSNKKAQSERLKEQRPRSRKSSGVRKEPKKDKHRFPAKETCSSSKPTFQSVQARSQSQWQSPETRRSVSPVLKAPEGALQKRMSGEHESVAEKRVVSKALNFAKKYRETYLVSNRKMGVEKPKVECSVTILTPKQQASKTNLLQPSLSPDLKENQRLVPPWPSYSETVHRSSRTIPVIKFPNQVYTKKSSEPLQAREFSTGPQHQQRSARRRLGNKTYLPCRRFSSLYDRPDCPKPEKKPVKKCQPLKRPKKKKIVQKRKCAVKKEVICPLRADTGLIVKRKKLPKITSKACKLKESKPKDCAPLKRLKKVYIAEPPKCEIIRRKICVERADDNLSIKKKQLPLLEPEDCPQLKPEAMKDVKLTRLKKVEIKQPRRVCVKIPKFCPTRADDFLKPEKKSLPSLKPPEGCLAPPPTAMKKVPRLPRFKKIDIPEPPKICEKPKKFCPERADEGLVVRAKSLPNIELFECPKPEEQHMKASDPLKRLPKLKVFDPPKCKIVKKKECSEATRADANLEVKLKCLPKLVSDSVCKPTTIKMKDCKPIKRLKKVAIPEPIVCSLPIRVECDIKRADGNLSVTKKRLPKLKASSCPMLATEPMKDVTLPRLKKVEIEEPPKICLEPKSECFERADDDWTLGKKKLPELKVRDCPKVKEKPMKDVQLLRLTKVEIEEPKKICPKIEDKCPERADVVAGYEIKKKPLRTVILSEKYNDISFRHFKKGKQKAKTPYFNTKRKYYAITRLYSNYHSKNRSNTTSAYRAMGLSSKECAPPEKSLCPPKAPPKKTLWQRICDYFRARPGCPSPDEWKKKRLREQAEKAAKAAGLHLCESPKSEKRKVCIRKKPDCCPKFKMPHCNESELRSCEKEVTSIECDPAMETPYPSFSEWKREMRARKISECKVADKNAKASKAQIITMSNWNKNKKSSRCFSTSRSSGLCPSFYTQASATRIINELDRELQKSRRQW